MKIYRILVVVAIIMLLTLILSTPRQLIVHSIAYIEITPIPESEPEREPERMMPGEPARSWELPVVIY